VSKPKKVGQTLCLNTGYQHKDPILYWWHDERAGEIDWEMQRQRPNVGGERRDCG
jgi:hypothetical protein